MNNTPILYSFRRCPYAIRARLAIYSAGIEIEIREVLLRDKAPKFLEVSKSKTVPCLQTNDDILDESLDIMVWALNLNDPDHWLIDTDKSLELIETCDGPFKNALDRTKYPNRYPDENAVENRMLASDFLDLIESQLNPYLFGKNYNLADIAILPFIRQFAHIDFNWFLSQPWPKTVEWLETFKTSEMFNSVMKKYPKWEEDDPITLFP
jgi:glutathione S-transferase|tara:strand:+ start:868 stop:1494 length:627 start_codon:yes stop_codon:yes gene_type:complete